MTVIKIPDIDDWRVLRHAYVGGATYSARILLWDTHETIHGLSKRMHIAFAFWPSRSYKVLFAHDKLDVLAAEPDSDRAIAAVLSYVTNLDVQLLTPYQKEWQRSDEANYYRDLLDLADSLGNLDTVIHNVRV